MWLTASFLLAALCGWLAYRLRLLTPSGATVAAGFGATLLVIADWSLVAVALAFFLPSSLLSKLAPEKRSGARQRMAGSDVRNARQVLANGLSAWVLAVLFALTAEPLLFAGYVGAFAAASADTWATEWGTLKQGPTRSVTTFERVSPGTSGGISALGLLGAALGALTVGLAAVAFGGAPPSQAVSGFVAIVAGAGFAASILDSLLGATVQRVYFDPETRAISDVPLDPTTAVARGHHLITNDSVNWLSTTAGAIAAGGATWLVAA